MKRHLATILLVAVFLLGVCLLLYPTVSDYWNSLHQTRAIGAYEDTLAAMTQEDYSDLFAQADDYNAALRTLGYPLTEYKTLAERPELTEYSRLLDVNGTGIMGYIDIPKIGVELPIYHGTDASVLNIAAGHLEGTSLPVGGEQARALYAKLSKHFMCDYDETGSIGKRYRRQDEIGTPYCICVDFDTEATGNVTVRDRDTMQQEVVAIADLENWLREKIDF